MKRTDSVELQTQYIRMYRCMRNYIWPFETVEILAELETEIFSAFPDKSQLTRLLGNLKSDVRCILADDEEFKKSFDSLVDLVKESGEFYSKLEKVQEVLPDENTEN